MSFANASEGTVIVDKVVGRPDVANTAKALLDALFTEDLNVSMGLLGSESLISSEEWALRRIFTL